MSAESRKPEHDVTDPRLDLMFVAFRIPSEPQVRDHIGSTVRKNAAILRHPSHGPETGTKFKGAAQFMEVDVVSHLQARMAGLFEAHALGNPEIDSEIRLQHLHQLLSGVSGEDSINPLARGVRPVGYDLLISEVGRGFQLARETSDGQLDAALELAVEMLPHLGIEGLDLDTPA